MGPGARSIHRGALHCGTPRGQAVMRPRFARVAEARDARRRAGSRDGHADDSAKGARLAGRSARRSNGTRPPVGDALERRYPDRLRVVLAFDNRLAHRIQAGSDIFLMPSRFEPCGLTQMYALKYGTVPVVRATGGLKDTVSEFDPVEGTGNGFVFEDYEPQAPVAALKRALGVFDKQIQWRRLMSNCFKCDFSWARAAREYTEWFERLQFERNGSA